MDSDSALDSVDNDAELIAVAKRHLGADRRVTFHVGDGGEFVEASREQTYDLIYADAWPGKFSYLDETLALLKPGGVYVIDDLLPQETWPEGHAPKVPGLISTLEGREGLLSVKLRWASGIMVLARQAI